MPVIVRTDLSPAQVKAARIADNRVARSDWDMDALMVEVGSLQEEGFDLDVLGFDPAELDALFDDQAGEGGAGLGSGAADETYTRKIKAPIYEPTGENPPVSTLADDTRTRKLVDDIRAAGLPEDVAAFLEKAAERHTVFNFARIAEFYAHADPGVQRLMEASALVIIDFDQAIENGFVRLTKRLADLVGQAEADDAA